jgi:hypothetical protein
MEQGQSYPSRFVLCESSADLAVGKRRMSKGSTFCADTVPAFPCTESCIVFAVCKALGTSSVGRPVKTERAIGFVAGRRAGSPCCSVVDG